MPSVGLPPFIMYCVADLCIVPMGVNGSVAEHVAAAIRVIEAAGLEYKLGGFGTSIEGEFQTVCKVIEDCHKAIHGMGVGRIVTDVRIGTRIDKEISAGGNQAKVDRVHAILAKDKTS